MLRNDFIVRLAKGRPAAFELVFNCALTSVKADLATVVTKPIAIVIVMILIMIGH